MGILNQTQNQYYNNSSNFGNYQFTSLDDIINQFMVAYIGEEKIISKASRTDVQFHAMRALAELSFDTFKSIKSQEIELPPSLTMILPHDYVNYTRVLSVDSSGVKHPLYPTKHTQNPFKILQEDDGGYDFTLDVSGVFENGNFSDPISDSPWLKSPNNGSGQGTLQHISGGQYEWKHIARTLSAVTTTRHFSLWQTINVSEIDYITISAKGLSSAAKTGKTAGIVRIGFSTQIDLDAQDENNLTYTNVDGYNPLKTNPNAVFPKASKNMDPTIFDVPNLNGVNNYIQFDAGDDTLSAATELVDIDVSGLTTVNLLVVSSGGTIDSTATLSNTSGTNSPTFGINAIDDIVLSFEANTANLQSGGESTTWSNYKSNKPSENTQHDYDYDDHIFEANVGRRYGLEPSHAQDNGSYYIDELRGKINFSSNLSGKTIVLDYISDSLGTDGEMQVHKFAEEAMYKSIMYAILSTRANTPEYIVRRYKKERFASIRQAKLRLSNIKLEEITQIFRGKSKHIKH